MKKAILILLCTPLFGIAQNSKNDCVEARWLQIENNETNQKLFLSGADDHEEQDLVKTIHRLVQEDKINIYQQDLKTSNTDLWVKIDYKKELKAVKADTSYEFAKDPYFEIIRQSDVPLADEYGEPLIRTNEAGIQEFVYPPAEPYVYSVSDCENLRIFEQVLYNKQKGDFEAQATGIGFYMIYPDREGEVKFWVKLDELYAALDQKEDNPWVEALVNKEYRGREYRHKYCDEE